VFYGNVANINIYHHKKEEKRKEITGEEHLVFRLMQTSLR